jgi:hypothetical protein
MKKSSSKTRKVPAEKLNFESPQNEESKRLSRENTASPVERKDEKKLDKGEPRGGNRSVNQG